MSEYALKIREELDLLKGAISAIVRNILIGKNEVVERFFKFSTNTYPTRRVKLAKKLENV